MDSTKVSGKLVQILRTRVINCFILFSLCLLNVLRFVTCSIWWKCSSVEPIVGSLPFSLLLLVVLKQQHRELQWSMCPDSPPLLFVSESLLLPAKFRERSPSPLRGFLIPSPLPTRRNRTFSAWEHTQTQKQDGVKTTEAILKLQSSSFSDIFKV